MLYKSTPTTTYLEHTFRRAIDRAKAAGHSPEFPLDGEADTQLARLVWRKMLSGKPVVVQRETYDGQKLRVALAVLGFEGTDWKLIAEKCEVPRPVFNAILYNSGYYTARLVTPSVQRIIDFISAEKRLRGQRREMGGAA